MSENTVVLQADPTTILRSLITPRVIAALASLTDEEIAAIFVTASEISGAKASYIRAGWRTLARRISQAIAPKK